MNLNSKKLTIPDLISVGVFTAIYFVLVTIATFSCALLPGVGNILLPAVAALISGSVYMLLAAKLQKFGGISIMGLVMGLFFLCLVTLCCPLPPTSFAACWQTGWQAAASTAAKRCCWPAMSSFRMVSPARSCRCGS